jgi:hypothetical protein
LITLWRRGFSVSEIGDAGGAIAIKLLMARMKSDWRNGGEIQYLRSCACVEQVHHIIQQIHIEGQVEVQDVFHDIFDFLLSLA